MWKEKVRDAIRWFSEKSEKRSELRVFHHYFPKSPLYSGILPRAGESLTGEEEELAREAGSLRGHYETELTPDGFKFGLTLDDPEMAAYLSENHMRMVGFVTYQDARDIRFPGTRFVEARGSKFTYTFPDLKQDINPISFYIHTLPVEGPNRPHPKYWRLGFRMSSPEN